MKRDVALEIGPMTSLLRSLDNDVIIIYYATLHYTTNLESSNLRRYLYELNREVNGGVIRDD